MQYEDNELMFSALKTGQVQAVSANLSVISEALTKDPGSFKIAYQTSENADQIAGAVAPEKKALLDKANKTIQQLKSSGELDKIKEKWTKAKSSSSSASSSSAN